jgi:hypothetical protein
MRPACLRAYLLFGNEHRLRAQMYSVCVLCVCVCVEQRLRAQCLYSVCTVCVCVVVVGEGCLSTLSSQVIEGARTAEEGIQTSQVVRLSLSLSLSSLSLFCRSFSRPSLSRSFTLCSLSSFPFVHRHSSLLSFCLFFLHLCKFSYWT